MSKTEAWSNQIVETTLGKLSGLEKAFKYCVTVTLMQKTPYPVGPLNSGNEMDFHDFKYFKIEIQVF